MLEGPIYSFGELDPDSGGGGNGGGEPTVDGVKWTFLSESGDADSKEVLGGEVEGVCLTSNSSFVHGFD
jgi:hypothetical protein